MEEKNNMTAERSLEIIRESIERSQRAITKNSALPLIWWGSVVVVFSLLILYLWKYQGGPVWNVLWLALWPLGYLGNRLIDKHQTPAPPSFVGKTIGHIWASFGIVCGLIGWTVCFIGLGVLPMELIAPQGHVVCISLTSIIALCFGMGSTITGFVLKSLAIEICGIIGGVGGFFLALQFGGAEQLYVMSAVSVISLIIPGLIVYLQNKGKE